MFTSDSPLDLKQSWFACTQILNVTLLFIQILWTYNNGFIPVILFSILISLLLLLEVLIFGNSNVLPRHNPAKPSGGAEMEEDDSSSESSQDSVSDSKSKSVALLLPGSAVSENSDVAGVIKMLDQARERLTEMKGGAIMSDEEDEENIVGLMKRDPQKTQTLGAGVVELMNMSSNDSGKIARKESIGEESDEENFSTTAIPGENNPSKRDPTQPQSLALSISMPDSSANIIPNEPEEVENPMTGFELPESDEDSYEGIQSPAGRVDFGRHV